MTDKEILNKAKETSGGIGDSREMFQTQYKDIFLGGEL